MEYDEAYWILNTNADSNKLFLFILKGDNKSAIEYVKQVTNCDEVTAKAIILDLSDGLTTENNNKLNSNQINSTVQSNISRCPTCGSTQIQMVNRKWSLLTGFMTNKVDRVCVNCKHRW